MEKKVVTLVDVIEMARRRAVDSQVSHEMQLKRLEKLIREAEEALDQQVLN